VHPLKIAGLSREMNLDSNEVNASWRREWDSNPQSILPVNMALTSNGGIAGRTSFAMDHQT
jgi:hypothetical protein